MHGIEYELMLHIVSRSHDQSLFLMVKRIGESFSWLYNFLLQRRNEKEPKQTVTDCDISLLLHNNIFIQGLKNAQNFIIWKISK